MKHIVMIIIAMGVACGYAQNRRFQTPWYQVEYDEALESPVTITYQVACTSTTVSRKGMDFKRVDSIHTSNAADYKHNVWDKGHMAPAAAFACDAEALRSTFLYVNCALQHASLNRGPWKELEAWERELAKRFQVQVTINVYHDDTSDTLATGAVVPAYFEKIVQWGDSARIFIFPNVACSGQPYTAFEM